MAALARLLCFTSGVRRAAYPHIRAQHGPALPFFRPTTIRLGATASVFSRTTKSGVSYLLPIYNR